MNIAEGDVFKDIKDVRVVEVSSQQLKSECVYLDKEIEELWRLMLKHSNRMCRIQRKKVNCLISFTEEEVTGECCGRLQHKV